MEVLVKDLCNPDVVKAIAKEGIFFIKDKPNLTPEIWERFRSLGDGHPGLSKSLQPEREWSFEGDETPGPDPPEIRAVRAEAAAKEAYETLIRMGGRPTRPIRSNPRWKTVHVDGDLVYQDAEEVEPLFYEVSPSDAGPGSSWTEAEFIAAHWGAESNMFEEELRRWRAFRNIQQWRREHRPDYAREEDVERQRYPQDPHLTASLKKLKDWKEYQTYFRDSVNRNKKWIENTRRAVEALQGDDPKAKEKYEGTGKYKRSDEGTLGDMENFLEKLAAEEKRLEWATQQLPAVLSECAASLMGRPTSCRQIEERSELEAKRVFNTLIERGGRPTRPMRPVQNSQERDHADQNLPIFCHWECERSQFEEELREWDKFLAYRQKKETNKEIGAQLEEQSSTATTTHVMLWEDYRTYQQLQVENTRQWVEFWQRQAESFQKIVTRLILQGQIDGTEKRYHSKAEDARSYMEEARKQVRPAEMRLEWVEQQLSDVLAECAVSTTEGQATLRYNRSDQSGPRSKHGKKNIRASVKSALDPIHPSKISKVNRRKVRPQSKILTEHDNGQTRAPSKGTTAAAAQLPGNITPRRSSRLCNIEKKSNARSPPLGLRRSDRISKQKETISTSTSQADVNSAVNLQTDQRRRRLSRFKSKGRLAGNKSDTSPGVKPRVISKRQQKKLPRKKTKLHDKR
ncbi:MAG: hypothetical protein Q9196_006425 [Gyalolechia fulgens]